MNEENYLKLLSQIEQPGKLKILYSYSYFLSQKYGLLRYIEPKDFVHEAITRLFSGDRNWDSEKFPDIITVLKGIIRSLISHEAEKTYYKFRGGTEIDEIAPLDLDSLQKKDAPDPMESLLYSEMRLAIEKEIQGDEDLENLYIAYLEGYRTPREIAEYLGKPVKEIYSLKRKLSRRCDKIIKYEEEK